MYTYYSARKELAFMFWSDMIDGQDMIVMETILVMESVDDSSK